MPSNIIGNLFKAKIILAFGVAACGKLLFSPKKTKLTDVQLERIIQYTLAKLSAKQMWLQPFSNWIRRYLKRRARLFYQLFLERFKISRPDLVVVWSGLALPLAAAAQAARDWGIPLLFCENGFLPRTIVMDPAGVNAANSLVGKPREFYNQVRIEPQLLKALFTEQLIQRPLKKASSRREKLLREEERSRPLPPEFLFLPLQVHDDSQVLLYSPRFRDMESLVAYCAAELKRYNLKNQTKLALVVKEHPSDYKRTDYHHIQQAYPKLVFIKTIPTFELLQACQAVVTINSTVGIEGLFCFKPVITLGEAFYNLPGLVYHLKDDAELSELLAVALQAQPDQERIQQFLYYLRYYYLVSFDRYHPEESNPAEIIRRIEAALVQEPELRKLKR